MKSEKITKNFLLSLIQEEAENIKKELQEEYTKLGDPIKDVKLNKNDGTGDSDKALVYKDKSGKTEKSGTTKRGGEVMSGHSNKGDDFMNVKLNQQPSKGGSDEKAATAVEVSAGAEKGGNNVTTGQHKANFKSKTSGPKDSVSDPFTTKSSKEMNINDKVVDEGTKTYVDAGAAKGGSDVTAGQHDASWKESAPSPAQKEKRISTAIQLKETYSKSELATFIMTEAKKLARKQMMEQEIEKLKIDIQNL